jgi:hypothetical protein
MLNRVIDEAAGRSVPDGPSRSSSHDRPGVETPLKREILPLTRWRDRRNSKPREEVAQEIDRMAQSDPRQAARVRSRYQSAERRQSLKESLRERKALDWLINAADVEDEVSGESPLVVPASH